MDVKQLSLKIVGFIWMLVGLGLSLAGINWMLQLGLGANLIIFLTTSLVIGLLKGKFVLQKVAKKYYKRSDDIQYNRNDIFIGWAKIMGIRGGVLVTVMMTIGMILRHSNIDRPILGIIYLAVGIALLYASKVFFKSQIANS